MSEMNPNQIKSLFPNASKSLILCNAADSGPSPALERGAGDEPLAACQIQKEGAGRVHVRITSRRKRLSDPDGLCAKYFLDCCRYCGWIADDSAAHITLETTQEKSKVEETIIEISYP